MTKYALAGMLFVLALPADAQIVRSFDFNSGSPTYGMSSFSSGRRIPGAGESCSTIAWQSGDEYCQEHLPTGGWNGTGGAHLVMHQGEDQFDFGWYFGHGHTFVSGDRLVWRFRIRWDDNFRWDGSGSQQNKITNQGQSGNRLVIHNEKGAYTSQYCTPLDTIHGGPYGPADGSIAVKSGIGDPCAGPVKVTYGRWYHVQIEMKSGDNGTAGLKIWVNNNNYAAPSAQKIGLSFGTQNWNSSFNFGGFWTDQNDTRSQGWVVDDLQIALSFDPNWNPGGSTSNQAPIANAGPDQNVSGASVVQLDGGGSEDPEGASLTYRWRQVSGTPVALITASSARPTFVAPASTPQPQTLRFELITNDGQLDSTADTVDIVVAPTSGVPGVEPANTGLPWSSDFEENNLTEWNRGCNTSSGFAIATGSAHGGTYAARSPLTSGTHSDNYCDQVFGDYYSLPTPKTKVEEMYLRVWSKFEPGYVWPNDSQKIAILNLTDGVTSTRRYQVYVYVNSAGQYAVDNSYLDAWRFYGLPQNQGTRVSVRWGEWDKLKLYVRLNTPGQADGIVKLWINDTLKVSYSNVNIREGTSYGFAKANLSSYSTDASGSNGVQWHDDFRLSFLDPDGSTETGLATPGNLRRTDKH